MTMTNYVIRRLFGMIPLLIGISMINFALYHFAPISPIDARLWGKRVPAEQREQIRDQLEHDMGLDKPVWRRYVDYMIGDEWEDWKLGGVVTLDFGHSWEDPTQSVQTKIFPYIEKTLLLFGIGFLLSLAFSTIVGVVSATRQYSIWDKSGMLANLIGYSLPSFVFGLIMRILALKITDNAWDGTYSHLNFQDVEGWPLIWQWTRVLVLPLFVIVIGGSTFMARLVRSQMLEVLRQDYIKTARAKGVAERTVIYKHAMRNALLPIVTIVALSLPGLLSGAAIVEMVFNYPGMGSQLLRAAGNYDFPILMALNLYYSFTTVFMLLVADVAYGIVDPRVRF